MSQLRKSERGREPAGDVGPKRTGRARVPARRTTKQLARQNDVYNRRIAGQTINEIADDLGIDRKTVMRDERCEGELRAKELGERRSTEKAKAVNFYEHVASRALKRANVADEILEKIRDNIEFEGKVTDRSLDTALHARERIDKVMGVEEAVKVDLGIQPLLDALDS